jgi:hypothetical protein
VRVERQQRVEDDLVFGNIKIGSAGRLHNISDSVFREQHATESGLFREEVVRRGPLCALFGPFAG